MDCLSRYPGARPFEKEEKNIFFGRDSDSQRLFELIRIEKTVLLYSKSGMGKTSLINAGLIPLFEKNNYNYFKIRLGLFSGDINTNIKDKIIGSLQTKAQSNVLNDYPQLNKDTISYWLKSIQINDPDKINVLIFDQFEEFFSYPTEQILEFKEEISRILFFNTTNQIRENILEKLEYDDKVAYAKDFLSLSSAIKIRIIFSIRSELLSKINLLTDYLPNLQRIFYELKPLEYDKAKMAIILPSKADGNFISPKFEFTAEALDKILTMLADNYEHTIESFQLQLVCQFAEGIAQKSVEQKVITSDDLGDIKNIYQNFYINIIEGIKTDTEDEKLRLMMLLEEEFIYEPEERRVLVLKGKILSKISESTLQALERTHLVRSEPFQDTFTYELSHDSLVVPILKVYYKRLEIEKRNEYEKKRNEDFGKLSMTIWSKRFR